MSVLAWRHGVGVEYGLPDHVVAAVGETRAEVVPGRTDGLGLSRMCARTRAFVREYIYIYVREKVRRATLTRGKVSIRVRD